MTDLQTALLHDLEPVVEQNLERHLSVVRPWLPHDYVPWSRGRDFAFLGGEDWVPDDSPLDPAAKAALVVNLLTEDNLPSYHREIATRFGRDGAWGTWVGQWTAEEGRHSIALRDYLVVTRGVDPTTLEHLRMEHTIAGYDSGDKTPLAALAYVSFQELATRVSHRNTGRASRCPVADQLLSRVAIDENLHMVFYRNIMAAALEIAPDAAMNAIRDEAVGFAMPGIGMTDFQKNSILIAKAGIYDLRIHHDDVLQPVLRFWRIFDRSDFGPEGEKARTDLARVPRHRRRAGEVLRREGRSLQARRPSASSCSGCRRRSGRNCVARRRSGGSPSRSAVARAGFRKRCCHYYQPRRPDWGGSGSRAAVACRSNTPRATEPTLVPYGRPTMRVSVRLPGFALGRAR